jgi:hypothetical protein
MAWADSTSNRNEFRNIYGGKARPARKPENLTAIYEPIVQKMWDLRVSQPYRSQSPYQVQSRDNFVKYIPDRIFGERSLGH